MGLGLWDTAIVEEFGFFVDKYHDHLSMDGYLSSIWLACCYGILSLQWFYTSCTVIQTSETHWQPFVNSHVYKEHILLIEDSPGFVSPLWSLLCSLDSTPNVQKSAWLESRQIITLLGTKISHQRERKLIFPTAFGWDILVLWRVF